MSELSSQTVGALITKGNEIINKGNEIITHARLTYIFRSSVAYVAQQVCSLVMALKPVVSNQRTDTQIQALQQVHELFVHLDSVLPHLTVNKWVQPALNWPATYVHKYIDGFRGNLLQVIPVLGLNPSDVIRYDEVQDQVNKIADLKALRHNIQNLQTQISSSDAVGLQIQIETKLAEINKLIPHANNKRGDKERRPSGDSIPIVQMKRKVEELLSQFKNINIEVGDLSIQGQIGSGGFGAVSKATRLSTSEIVAVKELRSDKLTMQSWASLYAEVESMASVRNQFVLELVGAHITEPYRIITRFCSGRSLFDRLHRRMEDLPVLNATNLTKIAYEVAVGMEHLHKSGIVHRDLKTLNILLDDEGDACVADFGLSGMMKDNQELCGGVGTPHYTAPEVLSHTRYGPKVDTFSYGVVLWEMLMKKVPYGDMSHVEIYEHVVTRSWRLPIPNDTQPGLKRLISRCWSRNPNDRPAFSEIVELFEKGEVVFPGSEPLDFQAIKSIRRCPPLDLKYALEVLRNPSHECFSSIVCFICSKIDDKLRAHLRDEKIMDHLVTASVNIDSVLVLASVLLDENEYNSFLKDGGLEMFKKCVEENRGQSISAALRFGLKVPREELVQLKVFLPQIVAYLTAHSESANSHILQFLTRYTGDELKEFQSEISRALLDAVEEVDDQQTFDAIVALLPLCKESVDKNSMSEFYRLLGGDFVVPSAFVSTLIEASDPDSSDDLILAILKATVKSDVTDVLLQFLKDCTENNKDVFSRIYLKYDLFPTMQELLETNIVKAPLFLMFCIAPFQEAALKMADDLVLQSLLQMKGYQVQRLQILSILCMSEEFCEDTCYIDGIIHLLIASLSAKSLVDSAVRLICAFSTHTCGCQILSDNGVLELFTQLFLSSSSGDSLISHMILRNVAQNGYEITQGSLIVSCLMQDLVYDTGHKNEILETLVALVESMPGNVQEHDLQRIVMQQLTNSENPTVIDLALKLFAVCSSHTLRNIYPQLLGAIYNILGSKSIHVQVIESCMKVMNVLATSYDITEFVRTTELIRFTNETIARLPESSHYVSRLRNEVTELESNLKNANSLAVLK